MNRLGNCFTGEVIQRKGIHYSLSEDVDKRANITWSKAAETNPIKAAAATTSQDYFAKFPDWINEYINGNCANILDAGCGYGRLAIPLLKRNPELYLLGVDASPVMLNKFLTLVREDENIINRVALYQGNLANIPVKSDYFDCIISCAVLLHLPHAEAREIINEMYRVLKPGGQIILVSSFPSIYNLEGIQNFVYEKFKPRANGPVRVYRKEQVKKLLSRFQEVKLVARNLTVIPRSIAQINLPFGSAIRNFNKKMTERYLATFAESGFLVSHYEVVAKK
ncbi:methyltransferase domain-containing protein [Lyngbya aestuarii]|uniref:methyltransferase domain-containing protein n=1 Tax=Lyngbya aestuarii TaxID=118322 RepID=UPI00403DCCD1